MTKDALVRLARSAYGAAPSPVRAWARDAVSSVGGFASDERVFALTLDDGPDPDVTPAVLDALAGAGWQATFFVLVDRAEKYPEITRCIVDAGHEVGLHGMAHRSLPRQRPVDKARLILEGKRRLEKLVHARVETFRPPYGQLDPMSFILARAGRLRVAAWTAQVQDWLTQPEDVLVERFLAALAPGVFMLVHDGLVSTPSDPPGPSAAERASWIPRAIEGATRQGFRSRSVRDILCESPAHRFPWFLQVDDRGSRRAELSS